MPNPTQVKVPVISKNKVEVITEKDLKVFEEKTNKFLETINDERILVTMTFLVIGEKLNNVIYYRDLLPMTEEDIVAKEKNQEKFTAAFTKNPLMPDVEKL